MVDAGRFADDPDLANMKIVNAGLVHDPSERFANVAALVEALVIDDLSAQFGRPVQCLTADIKGHIEDPGHLMGCRLFCFAWQVGYCRIHLASFECIIEPQVSKSTVTIIKNV